MTDRERISELEARVKALERDLAQSQELRRQAVAARDEQADKLKQTREQLKRLRERRAVRIALDLSSHTRRIVRPIRRLLAIPRRAIRAIRRRGRTGVTPDAPRATADAERDLAAAIQRDLPPATLENGPLVSIVILNRDGRDHLERCLRAVATTAYRDVEIIVVDNGSTDGSADFAEDFELPFPLRVLRNLENRSFSDANNQAARVATGDLLLFLNNDVEPITEGWLGYMVETLTASGAAAVGARLIYPSHRGVKRAGARFADLTLQHRGVAFDRSEAVPQPRVTGAGEDPRSAAAVAIRERPALTAACLLVSRTAFDAIGGFSSDYDYGLEDVDLCLKLGADGGRLLYDGRAALWHHESASRAVNPELRRSRVERNREAYLDGWGPRVFRDALLDAVDGGGLYSDAPFHVAIVGVDDSELDDGLASLGWRVSRSAPDPDGGVEIDPSVEAVIVVDPAFDIWQLPSRLVSLAWIRSEPERWVEQPWFDDYDIVLGEDTETVAMVRERSSKIASFISPEPGVASIRDAIAAWAAETRYGLRVGVPSRDVAERWGDYHFARGLQRSFERAGHPTRVHFLPDWASPTAARDDVAIHVFGLKEAPTRRGQVNILWQISHPDLATPAIYERYDHVFVASDPFAARMAERAAVPVTPLHQATDPERFRPAPGGPHHELLFVANSRKVHRRIVDDLAGTSHDLAIYGANWTPALAEQRFVKGDGVPNAELARYYSAADIVLNDHWNDMLAEGFISNRLYDALASGAFVISDHISGIETEFDGAVPTYQTPDELESLIDRYLHDPDERRRLADRGRAIVLERHTFDRRVKAIRDVAEPLAATRVR
jgi:GT2 family glycosyltransferase/glycosyltransferase involved in cell wall biosynthesis